MLVNTTGNSAMVPLMLGPTQPDKVVTVATSVETSSARSGSVRMAPGATALQITD